MLVAGLGIVCMRYHRTRIRQQTLTHLKEHSDILNVMGQAL